MIKQSKVGRPRNPTTKKQPHTFLYVDKNKLPECFEYTNLFNTYQGKFYKLSNQPDHPEHYSNFIYGAVYDSSPGKVNIDGDAVWFKWKPRITRKLEYWVCISKCNNYDFESWIKAASKGKGILAVMKNANYNI